MGQAASRLPHEGPKGIAKTSDASQAGNDMESFLKQMNEDSRGSSPAKSNRPRWGMYVLGGAGTIVAGVVIGVLPFITVAFRRHPLPYVPATPKQIEMVLKHCPRAKNPKAADAPRLVDLGSGDGRVTIAGARKGIRSKGYEINSVLVLYSWYSAWRQGVAGLASFHRKNLWKASLSEFDYIVLFGAKDATRFMEDLEDKVLAEETKTNAKLIACRFPLSTFEPIYAEVDPLGDKGLESVWVYDIDTEKTKRGIVVEESSVNE